MAIKKQIFLPAEVKKEMIETFRTTKETLWSALNFTTKSSFANMLRTAAYERGGVLYTGPKHEREFIPNCETTFETAEHTMTQSFGGGVRLVANLENGEVAFYVEGELKTTYENPSLTEFGEIQMMAQGLAVELSSI